MFLSEDHWKKNGAKKTSTIEYESALGSIFGVPKYAKILNELCQSKGITVNLNTKLVEVRGKDRVAVFEEAGTKREIQYDILHAVPSMSPPAFLKKSPSLIDAAGYVDVNSATLQSKHFKNVWAVGDSSNTPNSKTAAAVCVQSPVLVYNLMKFWREKETNPTLAAYSGYASCPIFTGDKKLLLAEFKYGGVLDETFPGLQNKPRFMFYLLKVYFLRWAYFYLMPRGRWHGKYGPFNPKLDLIAPKEYIKPPQ